MEPTEYSEHIDFQKYWLVLKRRWFIATGVFGGVLLATFVVTSRQERVYQAEGKLLFKIDRSSVLTGVGNEIGELSPLFKDTNPLSTEAEIIRSLPIAQKTLEVLGLRNEQGEPLDPQAVAAALVVQPIPETDVLQISYKSNDPELAAAVVNKVMEVYIADDILTNRAKAVAARKFISGQLPRVEAAVIQADAALRQFKEENRVVALEDEATAAVKVISDLENEIALAQAKLADTTARSAALHDQVGLSSKQAVAVSSISQSAGVQEVLVQLQEVQSQLAIERTRYQETYPTIANLRRKEAALNALLQERIAQVVGEQQVPVEDLQVGELRQNLTADLVEVEAARSGLANQLAVLIDAQSAYRNRTAVMPRLEQNQRELERRVQAAQSTYEVLLNKLQESQLAENQNIGNARVISTALIPEAPTAPNENLNLAAGGVLGFLLGIASAFLLDLTDKSVKTVREAKGLFKYTLLGIIPASSRSVKTGPIFRGSERSVPKVFARDMPRSSIREAYQMLQANLKFLSSDKELKVIAVTSSVPKEGKSEISANLAVAMAQVGRRVLLVDADMRFPSQHHVWELMNAVGLSNILVGDAEFKAAVGEVLPGLDVLTSGVIPPNPVALLDSKRMASLVEMFSKTYDFVIIDTPPLTGIADSRILGKLADGILLVVRPGVVDSASAIAARELIEQSGQNVLGLVANGVILKDEPDSYFYYTEEHYKGQESADQKLTTLSDERDLKRS